MHISCNVVLLPYYKQIKYLFDSTSWHRHRRCPSDPPSKPITSHLSSLPPHPYRRRGDGAFPSRMQRPRHQSKVCDFLTDRRRHKQRMCVLAAAPPKRPTKHTVGRRPLQTPPRASKWPQRPSQVSERECAPNVPQMSAALTDRSSSRPQSTRRNGLCVCAARSSVGRSGGLGVGVCRCRGGQRTRRAVWWRSAGGLAFAVM